MARQKGHFFIQGTIGNFTYYELNGKYYVKKKSSVCKERLLKSPEYKNTRKNMSLFGEAARIASEYYKEIDEKKKHSKLFGTLVAKVKALLVSGKNREEVLEILREGL